MVKFLPSPWGDFTEEEVPPEFLPLFDDGNYSKNGNFLRKRVLDEWGKFLEWAMERYLTCADISQRPVKGAYEKVVDKR